jgi:uncharacterized protein with von Willebrand factor type A (vWA) domain
VPPDADGPGVVDPSLPAAGRLPLNIMHFCRALRGAGLPVGPGRTLAALEAVRTVGIDSRDDVYWALHSTLVNRRDQRVIFDQVFHLFWRNPEMLKRVMQLMLPQIDTGRAETQTPINRRVAEAMAPSRDRERGRGEAPEDADNPPDIEIDASLTFSDRERLQHKDFEQMSGAEIAQAKAIMARFRLPVRDVATRRFQAAHASPSIDMRRTLRQSLRSGGVIDLARRRRRRRPPALVVLCDISGSMSRYSRLLLHFLHAVTNDRDRVHTFVFGTRLTSITRQLRRRDVDEALARVGRTAGDWGGGTRIGACLADFNRHWGRRVLGQGAVVLLITDGLDRDAGQGLEGEIDRLHRSCRRLVWLNPLLRYDGYAPRSSGARALMPHVDEFRPAHNLESLTALVDVLGAEARDANRQIGAWRRLAKKGEAA